MINDYYFEINVLEEQIEYASKLVEYSIEHHKVPNRWDYDDERKKKTWDFRFTGTLGEVVFADTYNLTRPIRSFGAYDGQDLGKDFRLKINGQLSNFDIKSMRRKTGIFYKNYVLNIPSCQLNKFSSITDRYFCISIYESEQGLKASFLGHIKKEDITSNKIGIFYPADSKRIRGDGTTFTFLEDTYEIDFKDFHNPFITKKVLTLPGYKLLKIK